MEEGCFSIIVADIDREIEEFGNDHDNGNDNKLEGGCDGSGRCLGVVIIKFLFCFYYLLLF